MAVAPPVHGNSPRHHKRIMTTAQASQQISQSTTPFFQSLQSHNPILSGGASSTSSATLRSNKIKFSPTSYISLSSPPPPSIPLASATSSSSSSSLLMAQQQYANYHSTLPQPTSLQLTVLQQQQACSSNNSISNANLIRRYNHHHSKRKSAVELLAESKPFYVKSETVLERQQQLNYRGLSGTISPSRISISHNQRNTTIHAAAPIVSRRSASLSSSSNLLQNKLRNLLEATDSSSGGGGGGAGIAGGNGSSSTTELLNQVPDKPLVDMCKYISPVKLNQELTIAPEPSGDFPYHYGSAYLSPKSLPPQPLSDDDIYTYSIELNDHYDTISPPAEYAEAGNSIKLRTPATMRYSSYQRSYSHSQAVTSNDTTDSSSFNINSHKSLPDLHSQICRHSPHSEVLSCCSRENRSNKSGSTFNRDSGGSSGHYTHRSEPPCFKQQQQQQQHQHQQQQPQQSHHHLQQQSYLDERMQLAMGQTSTIGDFRRDSGSSTQHSGNSYYGYGFSPIRYDCSECRTKIQDDANCLLNFTTLEVPEAFQDDFNGMNREKSSNYMACGGGGLGMTNSSINNNNSNIESMDSSLYRRSAQHQQNSSPKKDLTELSPPLGTFKRQRCLRIKQRGRYFSPSDSMGRTSDTNMMMDDRRPILRSKSDICDKYWHQRPTISIAATQPLSSNLYPSDQLSLDAVTACNNSMIGQSISMAATTTDNSIAAVTTKRSSTTSTTPLSSIKILPENRNNSTSSGLERFFEHLGLNDVAFNEFIATPIHRNVAAVTTPAAVVAVIQPSKKITTTGAGVGGGDDDLIESGHSSPVFFSDTSTIDSNRLGDSTEPNQSMVNVKPSEPPSIVERNARIIKWLCNCRKFQNVM